MHLIPLFFKPFCCLLCCFPASLQAEFLFFISTVKIFWQRMNNTFWICSSLLPARPGLKRRQITITFLEWKKISEILTVLTSFENISVSVWCSSLNRFKTHTLIQKRINSAEEKETSVLTLKLPFGWNKAFMWQLYEVHSQKYIFSPHFLCLGVWLHSLCLVDPSTDHVAAVLAAQFCYTAFAHDLKICTKWWVVVTEGIATYSQPLIPCLLILSNVQQQSSLCHCYLFKLWKNLTDHASGTL